ncbi:MAG: hypothetical protein ACRD21_17650, partial [Vicinamibacteria bacterium]
WHATRDILSIDGRHLFWDEPSTLRQIVSSYGIVVRESVFLLEELEHPRLSEPRLVRIVEAGWDAWVSAPEVDGVLLAAAKLERPWWLSLRKALLREDTMFISVRFEGGDERTFRFVPDQAQSGLWMSPLPRDVQELGRILRGNFSQARTEAIKFHGNPDFGPIVVTWSVLNLR